MNLKLLRKIKKAGFPETTEWVLRKYSLNKKPSKFLRPRDGTKLCVLSGYLEWELPFPTLEEAIMACDSFGNIEIGQVTDETRIWFARIIKFGKSRHRHFLLKNDKEPLDAVLRLWLDMNRT